MVVREGRETPFSRGILAQTLSQAGARTDLAYRVASEIRSELLAEERFVVDEDEVLARVQAKLQVLDALVVSRMEKWRTLRESSEPIVVLIGGATGVGTSTLAADLARRLNIQSVIGTDSVREILRRAISPDLLRSLHRSSYSVRPEDLRVPVAPEDVVVSGFLSQAARVLVGVEALVDRGLKEGTNLVIEGVHLVPEMILGRYRDHPNVCSLVVDLPDEELHRNRFHVRALGTAMRRPAEEYLAHFREIREIHDYIIGSAGRTGVRVVENVSLETASDAVVEIVLGRVAGIADQTRSSLI
jgi:2-phosphoglycerate kinase